jgi:microtubule-associated protein-like 6
MGQDDDHSIAVYDWANQQLRCTSKGDKNRGLALAVSPDGRSALQAGVKHIMLHQFDGRNARASKVSIGRQGKLQPFVSAAFVSDSDAVVGAFDGSLYFLSGGRTLVRVQPNVHKGPVYAVAANRAGLATGGKDGVVKIFSPDGKKEQSSW